MAAVRVVAGDGRASTAPDVLVTVANQPPVFTSSPAITSPASGVRIGIGGTLASPADPDQPLVVAWAAAEDPEGVPVAYTWQLVASRVFTAPLYAIDVGGETQTSLTLGEIAGLLDAAGVPPGDSLRIYHRVVATDGVNEVESEIATVMLVRGTFTAAEPGATPGAYALHGNYPNPFNPQTTISYTLPQASRVTLRVFDLTGKEVATLVDGRQLPGTHAATFDAADLPSGVYLYRVEAGAFSAAQTMMLLK